MWGGRGGRGGRGACACGGGGGGGGGWVGGGGMILGEVKARPKDTISFSLDYISKSKAQTSNPSSSPKPLDTPARPADSYLRGKTYPEDLVFSCTEAQVGAPLRTAMQQVHLGCAWGHGEARCYVLASLAAGCNSFFGSIGWVFTIIGIICSLLLILDLKFVKQNADLV